MARLKCSDCDKRQPEEKTALISGKRHGNYRMAGANAKRRVCLECTTDRIEYVRSEIARGVPAELDAYYFEWSEAAKAFSLDVKDIVEHERLQREARRKQAEAFAVERERRRLQREAEDAEYQRTLANAPKA